MRVTRVSRARCSASATVSAPCALHSTRCPLSPLRTEDGQPRAALGGSSARWVLRQCRQPWARTGMRGSPRSPSVRCPTPSLRRRKVWPSGQQAFVASGADLSERANRTSSTSSSSSRRLNCSVSVTSSSASTSGAPDTTSRTVPPQPSRTLPRPTEVAPRSARCELPGADVCPSATVGDRGAQRRRRLASAGIVSVAGQSVYTSARSTLTKDAVDWALCSPVTRIRRVCRPAASSGPTYWTVSPVRMAP